MYVPRRLRRLTTLSLISSFQIILELKSVLALELLDLGASLTPLPYLVVLIHEALILAEVNLFPESIGVLDDLLEITLEAAVLLERDCGGLLDLLVDLLAPQGVKMLYVLLHLLVLVRPQLLLLMPLPLLVLLLLQARHLLQTVKC